jgi:IS30 family transposase|tara:strand:- start:1097 stop:1405 length:309 start_codon:yes stop_codon:yes gene_type:complete
MALEPYKDKGWLYEHYVKKRMNLSDIAKRLDQSHNITISPQALYNWVKKFDLLKFRGKGRNLSSTSMRRPKSKNQTQVEKQKRRQRAEMEHRRKTMQKGRKR